MSGDAVKRDLRCVAYARLSTKEQAERSEWSSIDAQIASSQAYVKSQAMNGWRLVGSYTDLSTGADMDRPGLQRMLQDGKDGKFDCIVCVKFDRLSRSLRDFFELTSLFEGEGITFVCTTQPINTGTAAGRMFQTMLVSFGEFERETIVERVKEKLHAQAGQGFFCGGYVPLGYHYPERGKTLQIKEDEAEVVRLIFSLYEERRSVSVVSEKLREMGQKTKVQTKRGTIRGGGPFVRSSVTKVLHNTIYVGKYRWGGKVTPMPITPIISEETFHRVQEILDSHSKGCGPYAKTKYPYPLKGILRCGCCGGAMLAAPAKTGRFFYYRCAITSKRGTEGCPLRNLPAPQTEEAIWKVIEGLSRNEEKLHDVFTNALRECRRKRELLEKDFLEQREKFEKLQKPIEHLFDIIENQKVTIELLKERLTELSDEKKRLEEVIHDIQKQLQHYQEGEMDFETFKDNVLRFTKITSRSPSGEKGQHYQKFIDRIFIEQGNIRMGIRGAAAKRGSVFDSVTWATLNLKEPAIFVNQKYTWKKGFRGKKEMVFL